MKLGPGGTVLGKGGTFRNENFFTAVRFGIDDVKPNCFPLRDVTHSMLNPGPSRQKI